MGAVWCNISYHIKRNIDLAEQGVPIDSDDFSEKLMMGCQEEGLRIIEEERFCLQRRPQPLHPYGYKDPEHGYNQNKSGQAKDDQESAGQPSSGSTMEISSDESSDFDTDEETENALAQRREADKSRRDANKARRNVDKIRRDADTERRHKRDRRDAKRTERRRPRKERDLTDDEEFSTDFDTDDEHRRSQRDIQRDIQRDNQRDNQRNSQRD
ncbi:hypothetical protein QQX98_007053 [Neonectria punicea]|uniref:Uncharacterized protein n=1 Tax=Neonectria punicea TaxID=979145 RepID=A0ABR1GZ65_9HYPO